MKISEPIFGKKNHGKLAHGRILAAKILAASKLGTIPFKNSGYF